MRTGHGSSVCSCLREKESLCSALRLFFAVIVWGRGGLFAAAVCIELSFISVWTIC